MELVSTHFLNGPSVTHPPPTSLGIMSYGGVKPMVGTPMYSLFAPLPPMLDMLPLKRGWDAGSEAVRPQFQYCWCHVREGKHVMSVRVLTGCQPL
jgi:hypothetical protein